MDIIAPIPTSFGREHFSRIKRKMLVALVAMQLLPISCVLSLCWRIVEMHQLSVSLFIASMLLDAG